MHSTIKEKRREIMSGVSMLATMDPLAGQGHTCTYVLFMNQTGIQFVRDVADREPPEVPSDLVLRVNVIWCDESFGIIRMDGKPIHFLMNVDKNSIMSMSLEETLMEGSLATRIQFMNALYADAFRDGVRETSV